MSRDWVQDIEEMNVKFKVLETVKQIDTDKLHDLIKFRLSQIDEEVEETNQAFRVYKDADEVVDGVIDMMVFGIQTLLMLGVCPNEAWDRVLDANMQKEPGIKPQRPNPFGFPDLIKPEGWVPPTHKDNVGIIQDAIDSYKGD